MKKIIYLFLLLTNLIIAQYHSETDIYNYIFDGSALRMTVGTGTSLTPGEYHSVTDILNSVFDSDSNALKISLLSPIVIDTALFAHRADSSRRADTSFYATASTYLIDTSFGFVGAAMGGNLGIGTASPTTKLDVRGTIRAGTGSDVNQTMFKGVINNDRDLTLNYNQGLFTAGQEIYQWEMGSEIERIMWDFTNTGGAILRTKALNQDLFFSFLHNADNDLDNANEWALWKRGNTDNYKMHFTNYNGSGLPGGLWFKYLLTLDPVNARVGIGTSAPAYTLDINGDVNVAANITANDYKVGTNSIVPSNRLLIKSIDQLKANADSVDEVNKIIHLKPDTELTYIIDTTITTNYSLGLPLDHSEAMLGANNRADWIYTGTKGVFELLDGGLLLFIDPIRFFFPDGMFIHVNNPGINGTAIVQAISGGISVTGKKLGYIENGERFASIIPDFTAFEYEEGFTIEGISLFTLKDLTLTPLNYARINYVSQTVNFSIGDTVTGAVSNKKGVIVRDIDNGTLGTLTLKSITGEFNNGEIITGKITGSATTSGLLQNNIFIAVSDTVRELIIKNIFLNPLIPYSDRVNMLYIAPSTVELSQSNISDSYGTRELIKDFFATGSKNQKDIYWNVQNVSGAPNSTTQARISISGNTNQTTILAASTPTAINAIWSDGNPERFVFQDVATFDNTTDVITTAFTHGMPNGSIINFHTYTGTLPTGLSASINYYVINTAATTFQVSLTLGGGAVNFTSNGTGTNYIRHFVGNSASGWRIYTGLETITVNISGWMRVANSVGTNVSINGDIMKSNTAGTISFYERGSAVTVNNVTVYSSVLETLTTLSTGEGILHYVTNGTNTNSLVVTDARLTIRK